MPFATGYNDPVIASRTDWIWDNPAVPERPSIRTVRSRLPIVYWVGGTRTGLLKPSGEFPFDKWVWPSIPPSVLNDRGATVAGGPYPGTTFIDPRYFEVITVPYPGLAFPENTSIRAGANYLTHLINKLPADYLPVALSQGGSVCSQVYDQIRKGNLQHRRKGLLGAAMWGNTRKEQGHTFTDPTYGKWADPAPTKSGMWVPNLVDTEEFWWEMYDPDDVVACCENNPQGAHYVRDQQIRKMFQVILQNYAQLVRILANPSRWAASIAAYQEINRDIFVPEPDADKQSPHHRFWSNKPFADKGDTRVASEVMWDYVNTFNHTPVLGEQHRFEAKPVPFKGGTVTAGADTWWINVHVPSSYPAIRVGLNCYDKQGRILDTLRSDDATITGPVPYQFDPVTLQAVFAPPAGTVSTAVVVFVESEAMTTGTVWFSNPVNESI